MLGPRSTALTVVTPAPETPFTEAMRAQAEAAQLAELAVQDFLDKAHCAHMAAEGIAFLTNVPVPVREACRRIATAISSDLAPIRASIRKNS